MVKKIDSLNSIFRSLEFQKDKYKFYIALKIISDSNSIIYSNENDYVIMQMNNNLPIWIWTKDNINLDCVTEIMEIIELYFNKHSKITCKKEFYEVLLQNNINISEEKSFEMGILHCEKTILPKHFIGTMKIATISDLDILAKYWYDNYIEMEGNNFSLEQSKSDMEKMIKEGNFYTLKDEVGLVVGTIYTYDLIDSLEINTMKYIKGIHLDSYLQTSGFMILFTIIVSIGVHYALKKIDLIESLKSVE